MEVSNEACYTMWETGVGKKFNANWHNLHFIQYPSFHCRYVMSNLNISGRRIVTNEEVEQVKLK